MVRLAEIATLDQVSQVTHGWNKPVSESAHVADPGAIGGVGHGLGIGVVQGERFLTEHVLAL